MITGHGQALVNPYGGLLIRWREPRKPTISWRTEDLQFRVSASLLGTEPMPFFRLLAWRAGPDLQPELVPIVSGRWVTRKRSHGEEDQRVGGCNALFLSPACWAGQLRNGILGAGNTDRC